jgi:hypothetical protein
MISRLLESRIVDLLLIAAAIYFIFPNAFRRTRKLKNERQKNITVITNEKHKGSGKYDGDGEYIDYEEVK